jgi:FtsP/CotA-like multicopper oxidase with cupredoxin domain
VFDTTQFSRRRLLKIGAAGVGALSVPLGRPASGKQASRLASASFPRPYQTAFVRAPVLQPTSSTVDSDGARTNFYTVTEAQSSAQIVPGLTTPVWGYNGSVPGPTISLDQGTRAVLKVRNQLPRSSGTRSPPRPTCTARPRCRSTTGTPATSPRPGTSRTTATRTSRPPGRSGTTTTACTSPRRTRTPGWPRSITCTTRSSGRCCRRASSTVPITIADAMFAENGTLADDDHTESGLWGDIVLVNGRPWPVMQVKRRVYRFRILNASVSRSYRPRLGSGDPMTVVATDGGLMPVAKTVTSDRHGNAERYEILVDFSRYPVGKRVELVNLSNNNNVDYDNTGKIMAFDVVDGPFDTTNNTIPTTLAGSPVMSLTAADAVRTRKMAVERKTPWASGRSAARPGTTSSTAASACCWPTRTSTTSRSGRSRTAAAAGSTRCTSIWWTSRSSAASSAATTPSPRTTTRRGPRTSSTSARTRR